MDEVVPVPHYGNYCIDNASACDYSWDDSVPLSQRFPPEIQFTHDMFEEVGFIKEFNQAKLTLVTKSLDALGPVAD
jgi:hypothetical protein